MEMEKLCLAPISNSPLDSCRGRGKIGVPRRIRSYRTLRTTAPPRTLTILIANPSAAASSSTAANTGNETPTPTIILFLGNSD